MEEEEREGEVEEEEREGEGEGREGREGSFKIWTFKVLVAKQLPTNVRRASRCDQQSTPQNAVH